MERLFWAINSSDKYFKHPNTSRVFNFNTSIVFKIDHSYFIRYVSTDFKIRS